MIGGSEKLTDWSVKGVKRSKNSKCLELVSGLIGEYQPDVIVEEDYSGKGFRRCERFQELITRIACVVGVRFKNDKFRRS